MERKITSGKQNESITIVIVVAAVHMYVSAHTIWACGFLSLSGKVKKCSIIKYGKAKAITVAFILHGNLRKKQ